MFGSALNTVGLVPFTTAAVVLAQAFVAAPLYVRSTRIGFAEIDEQIVEAALWKAQRMAIVSISCSPGGARDAERCDLAWTRALGEFGATILFAGNLEGVTQTMPLAIYLGLERTLALHSLCQVLVFVSFLLISSHAVEKHKDDSSN